MTHLPEKTLIRLCEKEGWQVEELPRSEVRRGQPGFIVIVDEEGRYPLTHPYQIHLKRYRTLADPGGRFTHMKAAHDYLWPEFAETWNDWDEIRFRAHCENYLQIIYAGGASAAKSHCGARIGCIFWLANPRKRGVLVASVTLESLESRIWGYVMRFMSNTALPIPANIQRAKPPKILYPGQYDKIHGMFAAAIRQGEAEKVISTLIGRHPDEGLMVILDEATDMSPSIVSSLANLEKCPWFQLVAIGNSNSKNDLHGALATPAAGWDSVDPERDRVWPTSHRNSICLYFSPYESPAIWEPNEEKRARLGKFLITQKEIEEKKTGYGEDSESFWRFVLGWWKPTSAENVVVSERFLDESGADINARWSGFYPLSVVAGLDPAYQVGGTGCVLRLAVCGQTESGLVALDYRQEELMTHIEIRPSAEESAELQLAKQVLGKLREYRCPVSQLLIDATGIGRALGSLIHVLSGEGTGPWKIVSVAQSKGPKKSEDDPRIIVAKPIDLWLKFREFIQFKQIRGLDRLTKYQLVNRLVIKKGEKLILETKKEYRDRMAAISPKEALSPDEADSAILTLFCAILSLGFAPNQVWKMPDAGVEKGWAEKQYAFELERRVRIEDALKRVERPALVPNFSGSVEDMVYGKT